jgi:2-haloacid dehalogenase
MNVIFLDLDGTVFDFTACSRNALEKACAACGLPYGGEILSAFRQIDDALWEEQRSGRLSVEEVFVRRALQFTGGVCGQKEKAGAFRRSFQDNLAKEAEQVPHAGETLLCLSRKYRICAASNGILSMQRERLRRAGLLPYFSEVFVSEEIGWDKPDERFFQECLRRIGKKPEEVLMVGDSLTADIAGAERCGLKTCWYNPAGKENKAGCRIDREIWDLTDLKNWLEGEGKL